MSNPLEIDREGNSIQVGMVVAVAVTINQRLHFSSYEARIVKEREGQMIMDAPMSWGYVKDFPPEEIQILHADVDLRKLDVEFMEQFGQAGGMWDKHITTQDAHAFHEDVFNALKRISKDDLAIESPRKASELLVSLLSLAEIPDEKINGKLDAARLKLATIQNRLSDFMKEMKHLADR